MFGLVFFSYTVNTLSLKLWIIYNIHVRISNISWSYVFEIRKKSRAMNRDLVVSNTGVTVKGIRAEFSGQKKKKKAENYRPQTPLLEI